MEDKRFAQLLERAQRIAQEHVQMQAALTEAFEERYGVTYSAVEAERVVDALDYGQGVVTVAEVDAAMKERGAPLRRNV